MLVNRIPANSHVRWNKTHALKTRNMGFVWTDVRIRECSLQKHFIELVLVDTNLVW